MLHRLQALGMRPHRVHCFDHLEVVNRSALQSSSHGGTYPPVVYDPAFTLVPSYSRLTDTWLAALSMPPNIKEGLVNHTPQGALHTSMNTAKGLRRQNRDAP